MDDVQYLVDHAKEESYLFVVDSRQRDTAVHPSPSEYSVTFNSPFRNVFGMDLLDATVARAEYIVDTNTRTLDYALGQPASLDDWAAGAWTAGRRRTVTLDPGDYNLPQFVEHLNAKLESTAAAAGEAFLRCAPLTNPSEISNRVVLTCAQPFVVLAGTSTLRHTLGYGDPVTTAGAAEYAAVPGWSVNRTGGASDVFLSRPSDFQDADPLAALLGPVPAASLTQLEPVYGSRVVRQRFVSAADGPPASVQAYVVAVGAAPPTLAVAVRRVADDAVIASGALALPPGDQDDVYAAETVALTAASEEVLAAGQAYYVEFGAAGGAGGPDDYVGVYYNEDNLPVAGAGRFIEVDGQPAHPGFNLCCDLSAASRGHALVSPGLVNLSGPRYVNIRCPEVESHMFRDRVNEACHAGLGMVKLRGYGFREQRYDFVSFPPRRFHPVGRLSRLTFRLERPDGTLYDSHGVDHTLVLVLRYYSLPETAAPAGQAAAGQVAPTGPTAAPGQVAPGPYSLNRRYTPDLRRYMIDNRWAEEARAKDRISDARYGP